MGPATVRDGKFGQIALTEKPGRAKYTLPIFNALMPLASNAVQLVPVNID